MVLSGRGVGMDAVLTSIKELGGDVQIKSKKDIGSSFLLMLPNYN